MYDWILAVALLSGSSESEVTPEVIKHIPALREKLKTLAVEWEILDEREARYFFTHPLSAKGELTILRQRYHDLCDAPFTGEAMRFPNRETIDPCMTFNREYRKHIEMQQTIYRHRWEEYEQVLRETDELYRVWDLVRDATYNGYYVTVRRQALKNLREKIGPEAYYSGRLPPHVPIWYFRQID